ncbi:hypothetical protein CEXT_418601 [Caerostris extrusa]|uniref:Uncharacterized protein n=1 Tax=Caerostris extrusa TaxID=172846 RepID=A0AAV4NV03_CAEEX|nr:hypothetical protein CEXT_418601 [Caerostris extrusa]
MAEILNSNKIDIKGRVDNCLNSVHLPGTHPRLTTKPYTNSGPHKTILTNSERPYTAIGSCLMHQPSGRPSLNDPGQCPAEGVDHDIPSPSLAQRGVELGTSSSVIENEKLKKAQLQASSTSIKPSGIV